MAVKLSVRAILSCALLSAAVVLGGAGPVGMPSVPNLAALKALAPSQFKYVLRLGYTNPMDGGRAFYAWNSSACTLNSGAGDNGSQVKPNTGTGCWLIDAYGMLDARIWGQTYPLVFTVKTPANGGADASGANLCIVPSIPCETLQQATDSAARFDFRSQGATANVGSGTFAGITASGVNVGTAGKGISGQYLTFIGGVGGGTTTVNPGPSGNIAFLASNGTHLALQTMTLPVGANHYGVFSQNPGTVINLLNVICTGSSATATCGHPEAFGLIELNATSSITVQGTFGSVFAIGLTGYIEFDPGGVGNFSCGTGLTATNTFFLSDLSTLFIGTGWTFNANCNTATGTPVTAFNNATIQNNASGNIPGNGTYALMDNVSYYPQPTPTLGTCTNGAIVFNSTNSRVQVFFSGANTSCAIVFGKPSNASAWFRDAPICNPTTERATTVVAVSTTGTSNLGTTVLSGGLVNGDRINLRCDPGNRG